MQQKKDKRKEWDGRIQETERDIGEKRKKEEQGKGRT